jgi:hypothetical protein
MAQSLEVQIKATSDVPQAVDRAKEAITSLEKRASSVKVGTAGGAVEQTTAKATGKVESQFDKIGKSFGNTMSSVFLSFLGPLAIVSGIIAFVSNSIAEAKQLATDGLNRIAEGKSKLATDEETKMANFFKAKDAREKEEKEVAAGRMEMTRRFLTETEEGRKVHQEALKSGRSSIAGGVGELAMYGDVQKAALDAFLKSDEGKKYAVLFESEKANKDTFKPPEGFGNVIGVGPNPVMEAMARQIEIQEQSLGELKKISGTDTGVPTDFTKKRMTQ